MSGEPFTREELDNDIADAEKSFRTVYRAIDTADNPNEIDRLFKAAATVASVLAELRYQRERMQ